MLRLLQIDLKKLTSYRPFWVLNGLYALLIFCIPVTVLEFLQLVETKGAEFENFDPMELPVLQFPDIWHNVTYVYTFLKIFLAIVVIISVSNEFTYKTIRQNIIDGMSRTDFMVSKLLTILLLSLGSTLFVFLAGSFTGFIYTPDVTLSKIFSKFEFVPAYFLDLFTYMVFAFMLTVFLKRSALTIFVLLLSVPIEYMITASLPDALAFTAEYFPLHAMDNLIEFPFSRYWFQEIQDYVSLSAVIAVIAYLGVFIWAIHAKLKAMDL